MSASCWHDILQTMHHGSWTSCRQIPWDFHTQPSVGLLENDLQEKKYLLIWVENAVLMAEIKEEQLSISESSSVSYRSRRQLSPGLICSFLLWYSDGGTRFSSWIVSSVQAGGVLLWEIFFWHTFPPLCTNWESCNYHCWPSLFMTTVQYLLMASFCSLACVIISDWFHHRFTLLKSPPQSPAEHILNVVKQICITMAEPTNVQ